MAKISKKIIKNTIFNSSGSLISTAFYLILIPYMLLKLGPEKFGIWALVSVIFTVFHSLDFGTGTAFLKYFSEFYVKKDDEAFNRTLIFGILFNLLLMSALVFFAFLLKDKIILLLKIPRHLQDITVFVFTGACIIFAINKVFGIFTAILNGMQRMEITNSILVTASFFHTIGTFFVLHMGWGLKGLLVNQSVKIFLIIVGSIFFARKLYGPFHFRFSYLNIKKAKYLINYGINMQISNIANLFNLQTDKMLIIYFINLTSVSFYEIGQKLSLFFKMIVNLMLSALVPAISELDASGKKDSILLLYEKGNKYLFTITFPIAVFLLFFTDQLIHLWVGPGFQTASIVAKLLIIGITINMLTGIGTSIVRGIGKPVYETYYALISMILNITFGILFVLHFGFWGIIVATPLSVMIGSTFFIFQFHKIYNISIFQFFKKVYLKPFSVSVFIIVLLYLADNLIKSKILFESKIEIFLLLFVYGIFYSLFFLIFLKKLKYWDTVDKSLFMETTAKLPYINKLLSYSILKII